MKFISLFLLFIPFVAFNQTTHWKGTINVGKTAIELILNLTQTDTNYQSTWDIPVQKVSALASSKTSLKSAKLYIEITSIKVVYEAAFDSLTKKYIGTWTQGGYKFPLDLIQTEYKAPEIVRKQTPKAPFPYTSEEVQFNGATTGVTYGATLTYPKKGSQFPAIILINGSGQLDRNESLFGHQPFAVLADYFTQQGYAVLRVDDRGLGKTSGVYEGSTTFDFAKDVLEEIAYLKTRKEINPNQIGLVGHSEGGLIAPIVATQTKDVAFMILMAGPGEKIIDLMVEQTKAVLEKNGKFASAIDSYLPVYRAFIEKTINQSDKKIAYHVGDSIINQWRKNTADVDVLDISGIYNDSTAHEFVVNFIDLIQDKWYATFFQIDPTIYLKQVTCPVLAINGTKDVQVIAKSNLTGIENALTEAGNHTFKIIALDNLNHLFQKCKTGAPTEYGSIEETINKSALNVMGKWLKSIHP